MAQCKRCNALILDNRQYCTDCLREMNSDQDENYLDNLLHQTEVVGEPMPEEQLESLFEDDNDTTAQGVDNSSYSSVNSDNSEEIDEIQILDKIIDNFAYEDNTNKVDNEDDYDQLIDQVLVDDNSFINSDSLDNNDDDLFSIIGDDGFNSIIDDANNEEGNNEDNDYDVDQKENDNLLGESIKNDYLNSEEKAKDDARIEEAYADDGSDMDMLAATFESNNAIDELLEPDNYADEPKPSATKEEDLFDYTFGDGVTDSENNSKDVTQSLSEGVDPDIASLLASIDKDADIDVNLHNIDFDVASQIDGLEDLLKDSKKSNNEESNEKKSLFKRLFGNVGEEISRKVVKDIEEEERIEEENRKKEAEEEKKKKGEEKKIKDEEKKRLAEEKKFKAEEKKKAKEAAKAEKLRKRQEAEVDIVVKEGHINKLGALIVVVIGAALLSLVVIVVKTFSYSHNISDAKTYYEQEQYDKAYTIVAGIELKEDDKHLYNELRTIRYVESEIDYYESAVFVDKYDDALFHLIKGLSKYFENLEKAKEYEVTTEYDTFYKILIVEFKNTFDIDEASAIELANTPEGDLVEYINELGQKKKAQVLAQRKAEEDK